MTENYVKRLLRDVRQYKLVVFLVGFLLLIIVLMTGYIFEQNKYIQSVRQTELLRQKTSSEIPGAACTVLSLQRAEQLLNSSVYRSSSNLSAPLQGHSGLEQRHLDSCRYVSRSNSNLYVELFVSSFDNPETASRQYELKMPVVNDIKELDGSVYRAEKLTYDGGVHYLQLGRQIIEVAASNGSPSSQETFSRQLLDESIQKIQSL